MIFRDSKREILTVLKKHGPQFEALFQPLTSIKNKRKFYASLDILRKNRYIIISDDHMINLAEFSSPEQYDIKYNEKRCNDLKYWVTTAIALAAFAKSFFF